MLDIEINGPWTIDRTHPSTNNRAWISPSGMGCRDASHFKEHLLSCWDDKGKSFLLRNASDHAEGAVCAAWSPGGQFLVTGSGNHERALRIFDLQRKQFLTVFGRHHDDLWNVCWSRSGRYIASTSQHHDPQLKLWNVHYLDANQLDAVDHSQEALFSSDELESEPIISVRIASEIAHLCNYPYNLYSLHGLYGFGPVDIDRNDSLLVTVASLKKAGQRIAVLSIPDLQQLFQFEVAHRIADIKWSYDSRHLVLCTAENKAYRYGPIDAYVYSSPALEEIPVGQADLCRPHPGGPVCAFSTGRWWMLDDHPSTGRISIADLDSGDVISEQSAGSPVIDMIWARDGRRLLALCADGARITYKLGDHYP
jgi:WD40 repeat protein